MVSDGVWKYCGHDALRDVFKLPDSSEAASHLRSVTTNRSGTNLPDDFSVIAIDID